MARSSPFFGYGNGYDHALWKKIQKDGRICIIFKVYKFATIYDNKSYLNDIQVKPNPDYTYKNQNHSCNPTFNHLVIADRSQQQQNTIHQQPQS